MAVPLVVYGAMAGLQLLYGVQQANAIQKQAELSKQLDQFNIEQAQLDAYLAEQDGLTQMARYQNVIDEINAAQRVQFTAADIDPNFGSAKEIQQESQVNAALNLLDIQFNAHQKSMGYQKEANYRRTQSGMNQISANLQSTSVRNAAILNAANTAFTGMDKNGMFNKTSGKRTVASAEPVTGYEAPVSSPWDNVSPYSREEQYNIQYGGALGRIG